MSDPRDCTRGYCTACPAFVHDADDLSVNGECADCDDARVSEGTP